jgi:predicted dehydrogenase
MTIVEERGPELIVGPATDQLYSVMPRRVLNIGVIGYGYWGPNLVRNFQSNPTTCVAMVADLNLARLGEVQKTYPNTRLTQDYMDILRSDDIDAVIVATPVSTHFPIARDALSHGKHVFVEKPLSRTRSEGRALIDLAAERGLVLMVGHTFEYNPAVEMLKDIIASGKLGRVYYAHASRTNLGLFQKDINVLWDLAPHDISIFLYVFGMDPISVSACGEAYVQSGIHDVVRMTMVFPDRIQAHVHVSWLDPCKTRRITVVGDKKMAVYDDVEALEKIKIHDKGVQLPAPTENYGEFQLSYRYGDITIPRVPPHEPLKIECAHFADSILHGRRPRSDGEVGLKVVKILESAEKSLRNGGLREPIEW